MLYELSILFLHFVYGGSYNLTERCVTNLLEHYLSMILLPGSELLSRVLEILFFFNSC
jgi:hypothetical protein